MQKATPGKEWLSKYIALLKLEAFDDLDEIFSFQ